jgi:hypothetical protein
MVNTPGLGLILTPDNLEAFVKVVHFVTGVYM